MRRRLIIDMLATAAGGQVTRAQAFIALFRKFDASSDVIVIKRRGILNFINDRDDINVIEIDVHGGSLGSLYRMAWENVVLPRHVRAQYPDTLLTFSHYLPWTLPQRIRTIVGVSNLAPFSPIARKLEPWGAAKLRLIALRRTILSSVRRADTVMALSNACRDTLVHEGISAEKIVVVPNGVDAVPAGESSGSVLAEHGVNRPFLLCVSHFYRYKNLENLLLAYAMLAESIRDAYSLVLIGRPMDGAYFNSVQALIEKMDLRSNVRVIPGVPHEALGEFYRQAVVFVFPSYVENCPNSLLEAMSLGATVISSRSPPMPEFAGDAALYFDANSPSEIAEAIEQALEDEQLRYELGARAIQRASEYSWERFTRRVIDLHNS